jgi:predicted O-linked N-acetylglucosamine transferase (SPINDLY family)
VAHTRLLDEAVEHHQAGRLVAAERLYQEILALPLHPDEPDALHLMGLLVSQKGDAKQARELIERAIALRPTSDLFHINLGTICSAWGLHEEAIAHFRQALALNPKAPPAVLLGLGQSLAGQGRMNEAVEAFEWALRRQPSPEGLVILGEALIRAGRLPEALQRISQAVQQRPRWAEAHGALGLAYEKQGRLDEAEQEYRMALALKADLAEARNNLGHVLALRGRWPQAVTELRQAIVLRPDFPQAHCNLADALRAMGQSDEAIAEFRRAVELKPDFPEAWEGLGRVLLDQRQFAPAADAFRKLVALRPTAEHYITLGITLRALDEMDEAITALRQAAELQPNHADAHIALGSALQWCGKVDEAIVVFRQAIALSPTDHVAHSHLLYAMLFQGEFTADAIFTEHVAWAKQHTGGIVPLSPAQNDPSPDRRLKIGYVSPNFRNQAILSFVLPIIEHRDPWETEVFCYSDVRTPDQWTRRLRDAADEWRDTADLSHEQLAQAIRKDRIDILIDLTGHIGQGRLQTFAYQPAPVQMSYIGYQATTGLEAIDYFLTDDWANPPGQSDPYFVEQLVRLPDSFFCYAPPPEAPPVGPLPAESAGHITFGCLNNLAKVTPRTISLWSRALLAVPNSRFILLTPNSHEIRERIQSMFTTGGIAADRIEFVRRSAPAEYLARYNRIDIALDPVPFNGHTTTCDAAWMGCPTVTLAGKIYAYRYGGSVLRNIGLGELIANSEADYLRITTALAMDLSRLAQVRATLRSTMNDSPITDALRFTRNLETAYRRLWQTWCSHPPGERIRHNLD